MRGPQPSSTRRSSFKLPTCNPTIIYAPQYFITAPVASTFDFTSTSPVYPLLPTFPSVQFTTTSSNIPVAATPYYTNFTASAEPRRSLYNGLPTQTAFPSVGGVGDANFPDVLESPTALTTYRFPSLPPSEMSTGDPNRIVELGCHEGSPPSIDLNGSETDSIEDDAQDSETLDDNSDVDADESLSSEEAEGQHHTLSKTSKEAPSGPDNARTTVYPSVLTIRSASSCAQAEQSAYNPAKKGKRGPKKGRTKLQHVCKTCDSAFTRAHDLKRHQTIHISFKDWHCPHCSKSFGRKDALKRHLEVRGPNHDDYTKRAPARQRGVRTARSKRVPSDNAEATPQQMAQDYPTTAIKEMPTSMPISPAEPTRAHVVSTSPVSLMPTACHLPQGLLPMHLRPFKVTDIVPQVSSRSASTASSDTTSDSSALLGSQFSFPSSDRRGSLLPPSDGLGLGDLFSSMGFSGGNGLIQGCWP